MTAVDARVSGTFLNAGLEADAPAGPGIGLPKPAFYATTDTHTILRTDDYGETWYPWLVGGGGTAGDIEFVPAGTIGATNVQAAIEELDTELPARISSALSALVAGAPAALDTLDELAAALGDDANFASTVTSALAGKMAKAANLSDVASAAAARTNLGLGTAATKDVPASGDASATQVVLGNDSRLAGGSGGGSGVFAGQWQATPDERIYLEDFSASVGSWGTSPANGARVVMTSAIGSAKPPYGYVMQGSMPGGATSYTMAKLDLSTIPAASGRTLTRLRIWHAEDGSVSASSSRYSQFKVTSSVAGDLYTFTALPPGPTVSDWQVLEVNSPSGVITVTGQRLGHDYQPDVTAAIANVELFAAVPGWTGYDSGQVVVYAGHLYRSNNSGNTDEPTVGAGAASWSQIPLYGDSKTPNAQTGVTYTLVRADESKVLTLTNASAITLTVPANSSVAFPIGTRVTVIQGGAGGVTFTPASGVTINNNSALAGQWQKAELVKTGTDTWVRTA